jgi:hypothetical protein
MLLRRLARASTGRVSSGRAFATASVSAGGLSGKPAVVLASASVEVKILTGGGHIASITHSGDSSQTNPLWEPPWDTRDPALRRLLGPQIGDGAEGELLSCIAGHNLCLDVFGAQSEGETQAGLCFHGEAGLVS